MGHAIAPGARSVAAAARPDGRVNRRVAMSLVAAAPALLLAACQRREALKLGFIAGLSGTAADLGTGVYNGVQLAVEELNAAGGLNGHPVELLVRDDRGEPETVRRHVVELAEREVELVIGPVTSSMALAALDVAAQTGLVLFSPTATSDELSDRDDHFLRSQSPLARLAEQHARHIYRSGARRLALVVGTGNDQFSGNYERVVRRTFTTLGGLVLTARRVGSGVVQSFAEVAALVLADAADAVLTIASVADTALFFHQLQQTGKSQGIRSSAHWGDTPALLKSGGAALEGLVVTQYFDPDGEQPAFVAFRDRYRRRYGEDAGFAGIYGHDAARYVLSALAARRRGQTVKEALLQAGPVAGLQGPISLDAMGDGSRSVGLAEVRNGRLRAVRA